MQNDSRNVAIVNVAETSFITCVLNFRQLQDAYKTSIKIGK
jgi:hypothetical protein